MKRARALVKRPFRSWIGRQSSGLLPWLNEQVTHAYVSLGYLNQRATHLFTSGSVTYPTKSGRRTTAQPMQRPRLRMCCCLHTRLGKEQRVFANDPSETRLFTCGPPCTICHVGLIQRVVRLMYDRTGVSRTQHSAPSSEVVMPKLTRCPAHAVHVP